MVLKKVIIFSVIVACELLLLIGDYLPGLRVPITQPQPRITTQDVTGHQIPSVPTSDSRAFQVSDNLQIQEPQVSWLFRREILLTVDSTSPTSSEYLLLLVRKLALVSIREINQRISEAGEKECSYWWVNPLSVTKFEQWNTGEAERLYNIEFNAQPGNIPFQVSFISITIHAGNGLDYRKEELLLVNAMRLDKVPNFCGAVKQNFRSICLCPEEKLAAEKFTSKLRSEWEKKDPEHPQWPPNSSFFISELVNFEDKNFYMTSPSSAKEFCDPEVKFIIFACSAPNHTEMRNAIRYTFGNPEYLRPIGGRLLFLFGKVTDENLQAEIDKEVHMYDDIVQADYHDSYHNLSICHLATYNWVVKRCKGSGRHMPKLVFKVNDDYMLNIPLWLRIAEANPDVELLGMLWCGGQVTRNNKTKYWNPRYMYPPHWYSGFLAAEAYLVQTKIFEAILHAAKNIPFVYNDDPYVTAMLTKQLHIAPRNSQLFGRGARIPPDTCNSKLVAISPVVSAEDMEAQGKAMLADLPNPGNCSIDESFLKVDPLTSEKNESCFYDFQ